MTPNKGLESLISAKKAAEILGCCVRTVTKFAERGELPAMRIGNRWMFLPSLLDSWRRKKLMSNCSEFMEQEAR